MIRYHLQSVLLERGWARDAVITVANDGLIDSIEVPGDAVGAGDGPAAPMAAAVASPGAPLPQSQRVSGIVIPGMPNAHSHAFQRGMAGNTEYRRSARDSFWTWRQAMYALANRIEADDLQILATQLFIEMLKSGYTSVAEFHYLHRQRDGGVYRGNNALWEAVAAAAAAAGMALTLLPTLYQTSDFGSQPLKREQARFALATDHFLRAVADRIAAERRPESAERGAAVPANAAPGARALQRTGAAFHSLRAVPLTTLRDAALALRTVDAELPLHIHVAEQIKEVAACKSSTGRRPVELLLDTGLVDQHWCLVHATHATAEELQGIAATGATVCVSISTEANLGDGFFDAQRFLRCKGRICVGSDSQATVCPAEELRWMEYQQRLLKKRRGVLAGESEAHAGTRLWRDAALHGAAAIGQPSGRIAVGQRADWLVLDDQHAAMAGAPLENALDHLVFAGATAALRDVMVGGQWVVRDRRHAAEGELRGRFSALMTRLAT